MTEFNNANSFTDFPADPGCASVISRKEDPACYDGVDNDGVDGIDLADPAARPVGA